MARPRTAQGALAGPAAETPDAVSAQQHAAIGQAHDRVRAILLELDLRGSGGRPEMMLVMRPRIQLLGRLSR